MNAEFLVAVHALAFLNHKQCCVSSEELAKNICTNPARVRKVMLKLKNAGLVETVSGSLGGYSFTKKAERVSLKDILRATGGTVSDIEWKSGNEDSDCLISSGMGKVMDDVIENINLGAEKYYVTDIGIRNAVNGFKDNDINGLLENIVFIELLSRGYKVYIGKQNNLEVDFVAEKKEERIYIQVAYQLTTKETTDREFKPFESISDNYEKLILTLDETPSFNRNGIKRLSLIDWLFNKLNLH